MGVWPLREHSTKPDFDRALFAIIRSKTTKRNYSKCLRGKNFFLVFLRFKQFQDDFFLQKSTDTFGYQLLCYSESWSSGRGQNAVRHLTASYSYNREYYLLAPMSTVLKVLLMVF